jgi:stage II sporulation protein D
MPLVRVGLLVDTTQVDVSAEAGFALMDGEREVATFGAGEAARVAAQGDALAYAAGGAMQPTGSALLTAKAAGGGTLMLGDQEYRGEALLRADGGGRMTVINRLDMETYLLGVVPKEIGRVGPDLLEAAKAQAVAARTYAVRYLGRREALGFDVFATVADQVYGGVAAEHDPVSVAVRETEGEIITYEGQPIEAFYHSTCAGVTASIQEVWQRATPTPYLVAVADVDPETGIAYDHFSNRFTWSETWSAGELNDILRATLADSLRPGETFGRLVDIRVLRRTPSGRIHTLEFLGTGARVLVGGDRTRWALRRPSGGILNSSKFDVHITRDAQSQPVEVTAVGGGWGHGIGMCQVGAMGRARDGQDYRTILETYYTGAEVTPLY